MLKELKIYLNPIFLLIALVDAVNGVTVNITRMCRILKRQELCYLPILFCLYNTYNTPSHRIYWNWRWDHTTKDRRNKQIGHDKHFQARHFFQSSTLGGSLVLQNPIFSNNMYELSLSANPISGAHPKLEDIKERNNDSFISKWII